MVCESCHTTLDAYLDGELAEGEMRAFDAHLRSSPVCSADALARIQMKRAIQSAGKRFRPSVELRKRIQQSIGSKPRRWGFRSGWSLAAVASVMLVVGILASNYLGERTAKNEAFSEIADLHVATLASSSPVDVISTDRHTVKPWFQGRIPFSFNLPELQKSEFTLVGGRMAFLQQTPGAQLIYDIRKHHISVFIFPQAALQSRFGGRSPSSQGMTFNMDTWTQGGLRYFVIGDASPADIQSLSKLFKLYGV